MSDIACQLSFVRSTIPAEVTLVAPPPHFILPENVRQLLLKRYAENDLLELQAQARDIPCDYAL